MPAVYNFQNTKTLKRDTHTTIGDCRRTGVAAEGSVAFVGMMAWHHMPLPPGGTPLSGETLPSPGTERPFSIRMSSGLSAVTTTATMFLSALYFSFLFLR